MDVKRATRTDVLRELDGWAPEGAPAKEMQGYVRESAGRLLATARVLAGLPQGARVLEVGANPYFLTVLMKRCRPDLDWVCTNWHGDSYGKEPQKTRAVHEASGADVPVVWYSVNVEQDAPAFDRESFDAVAYCEVLEHLVLDPVKSLEYMTHVLKPGGMLLLTTPNPARVGNIAELVKKRSIGDPLSGYGIYGRHNREYARGELLELLTGLGYAIERYSTVETSNDRLVRRFFAWLGYGEHHLIVARRGTGAIVRRRPRWLYRSYEESFYDEPPG
jgi:SAM-dependent methyltransferase